MKWPNQTAQREGEREGAGDRGERKRSCIVNLQTMRPHQYENNWRTNTKANNAPVQHTRSIQLQTVSIHTAQHSTAHKHLVFSPVGAVGSHNGSNLFSHWLLIVMLFLFLPPIIRVNQLYYLRKAVRIPSHRIVSHHLISSLRSHLLPASCFFRACTEYRVYRASISIAISFVNLIVSLVSWYSIDDRNLLTSSTLFLHTKYYAVLQMDDNTQNHSKQWQIFNSISFLFPCFKPRDHVRQLSTRTGPRTSRRICAWACACVFVNFANPMGV